MGIRWWLLGDWQGIPKVWAEDRLRLVCRAWYKKSFSMGLVCYFTDGTNRYRLFAWRGTGEGKEIYNPKKCDINFATVKDNTLWDCVIEKNKKGNLEWRGATPVTEKGSQIEYEKNGDYLVPNILPNMEPDGELTKYGLMRKNFLKNHRAGTYQAMLLKGTLKEHLLQTQEQAQQRFDLIVKQIAQKDGITAQYKIDNLVQSIRRMSMIEAQADEIVLNELIYV